MNIGIKWRIYTPDFYVMNDFHRKWSMHWWGANNFRNKCCLNVGSNEFYCVRTQQVFNPIVFSERFTLAPSNPTSWIINPLSSVKGEPLTSRCQNDFFLHDAFFTCNTLCLSWDNRCPVFLFFLWFFHLCREDSLLEQGWCLMNWFILFSKLL